MSVSYNTKSKFTSFALIGEKAILVPYLGHHVPQYHEWMKRPSLLELTASEPLSLENELEMQEKWFTDLDKLTFIILSKDKYFKSWDEVQAMVGDVNIFLSHRTSSLEEEEGEKEEKDDIIIAELEIMLAEESYQRQGLSFEALKIMMTHVIAHCGQQLYSFVAKIAKHNAPSIALFKKIGMEESGTDEYFQEIHFSLPVQTDERINKIIRNVYYETIPYDQLKSFLSKVRSDE